MRIPIPGPILAVLNPNRPVSPPILHKNGLQSVENSTINNSQAIIGYSGKNENIFICEEQIYKITDALSSIDCRTLEEEEEDGCINYANDLNTKLNWKMTQKLFSTTF